MEIENWQLAIDYAEAIGWTVTIIAVTGVVLNNHRRRACFAVWMVSNLLSAGLHMVEHAKIANEKNVRDADMITPKYAEKNQGERWKNDLAKQLNKALSHTDSCRQSADVIEALTDRIAGFEAIQTVEALNPKRR